MVSVDRNNLNSQGLTNCSKAVRISTDDDIALSKIAIRQGTAENISVVYDNAINTLKQYQKNQGFINVNTVIKSLEQEKEFATNRLMYSSEHEGDFKREFKEFTGKEYNEDEMKELLSNKDDEASYAKAFGIEKTDKNGNIYYENNVINNALKKIKYQEGLLDSTIDKLSEIIGFNIGTETNTDKSLNGHSYYNSYVMPQNILKTSATRIVKNPEKELRAFVDERQKNGEVVANFANDAWFSQLAPVYKKYPDETEKVLTEVVQNSDGTVEPRFRAFAAEFLAPVMKDYPKEYEILKNETKIDLEGNIVPRFTGFEIKDLAPLLKEYPKEYNQLKKETTINFRGDVIPRFNGHELKELIPNLHNSPDLYGYFINQATVRDGEAVPRFDFADIKSLVELYKKAPDSVDKVINIKNPDGTHAFNHYSGIEHLVDINNTNENSLDNLLQNKKDNGDYFDADFYSKYHSMLNNPLYIKKNVQKLLDEKFPEFDAPLLSRVRGLDTLTKKEFSLLSLEYNSYGEWVSNETLAKLPDEFSDSIDKGFYKNVVSFLDKPQYKDLTCSLLKKDKYYPNAKRLQLQDKQNNKIINLTFDENGALLREDTVSANDINSSESKINIKDSKKTILYKQTDDETLKTIKDENGNIISQERRNPSNALSVDNIYKSQNGGKEYITEFAEQTPKQNTILEKNIVSPNGTKNDYIYGEEKDGSRFLYNKITDADGNTLLLNKKKLKHINDNLVRSVENGIGYEAGFNYDTKSVKVTRFNKNGTKENVVLKFGNQEGQISLELFDEMKNIPASTFFKLKQYGLKGVQTDYSREQRENACYRSTNKTILLSPELAEADSTRVFLHEFGHFLDDSMGLSKDKKLLEIYNKEKEKFFSTATNPELGAMDYFTSLEHKNEGGAITEVIAEIYAINNSVSKLPDRKFRGMYLQQYFPETMAYIGQKLDS